MSIFKDMLATDVKNIFFNIDELAELYEVDGRLIPVVQDDNRILEKTDISAMGTDLGQGLIFVRAADMPRLPNADDEITINGKKWYVREAKNNTGVYEIRIHRNRQYD